MSTILHYVYKDDKNDQNYKDYYQKYEKYKMKYLELKNINNQIGGKKSQVIIHISGPSGAGKTTLGNKLKNKFGNKIVVKDIDDLRQEFIKEHYGGGEWSIIDKEAYQNYIDKYITKQNKPLVFVGLNNMPFWHKNHYYNMHSTYNYYIEIDDIIVVKQKCLRLFENLPNDKMAINDLINNNEKFIKMVQEAVEMECGKKETIKLNQKWNKDYKKQGYKFMSREDIFKEVVKILKK